MCLILVAWRTHPDYPLVVAANRDEFFARPAARAGFWPEAPNVIAGRDLQAGGTWMGATRDGRFAALTNFRDPAAQRPDATSRGNLVAGFLQSRQGAAEYLAQVATRGPDFNGFNLIVGDGQSLAWYSNVAGGEPLLLEPGIYGICNHLLDTPWPKVQAAKSALGAALEALPDDAALFELLRDDSVHPDEALPRTGVSLEWERLLSAAFVKARGYGTRNSTLLLQGKDGWTVFDEQTWLEDGVAGERQRYRFRRVPAPS
jgi:uncharacterized protein with NRDE domain